MLDEIEDDVDESQFIPAYLSQTENDNEATDLNQTELNTDFNTARPPENARPNGRPVVISRPNSGRNSGQNSARDTAGGKQAAHYFNSVPTPGGVGGAGGLTERGKAAAQMGAGSGVGSVTNSDDSFKIS